MSILYLLLPIALIFLVIAVGFFFWAIRNGQYDDMESQALKIIIEDRQKQKNEPTVCRTQQPEIKHSEESSD